MSADPLRDPAAVPVEAALLGSVLVRPSLVPDLVSVLGEDGSLFTERRWGLVWDACVALWRANVPLDVVSLGAHLAQSQALAAVGGYGVLGSVFECVATAQNAPRYAALIREAAQRRALRRLAFELGEAADTLAPAEAAASAITRLAAFAAPHGGAKSLATVLEQAVTQWAAGPPPALTTGFPALDATIGGFLPGHLVYLAAQTSRGKTAWALHFAAHVARHHGAGVAVFSLEMTATELAERLVAPVAHASATVIRTATHTEPDLHRRVVRAAGDLSGLPIWVQDASSLRVEQVVAESKRLHEVHGLGLVIVDYIGLLRKPDAKQSRNDWLGDVSQQLKALAKDLGCPVLALSQLSREAAKAARPPELHDLRDSGNLEQDANVVLMLHRPRFGHEDDQVVRLDMLVRKNRGGPLGEVPVGFRRTTGCFEPWT